jgi:dTDP-4-dehydrorhamnose reductase
LVLTGAGGLIGRAIFPLLPADWDVLRTDLEANNGVGALDVTDPDACHQVFAGADAVVHLALFRTPLLPGNGYCRPTC